MTENDLLQELRSIKEEQRRSAARNDIAFGITIAVIGVNFLASATEFIVRLASGVLAVVGLAIMFLGARRWYRHR